MEVNITTTDGRATGAEVESGITGRMGNHMMMKSRTQQAPDQPGV
jgi:hypothetical protein